jgi:hypothetical protein
MKIRPKVLYVFPVIAGERDPRVAKPMPGLIAFQRMDEKTSELRIMEIYAKTDYASLMAYASYVAHQTVPWSADNLLALQSYEDYVPFEPKDSVLPNGVIAEVRTAWSSSDVVWNKKKAKELVPLKNAKSIMDWVAKMTPAAFSTADCTSRNQPLRIAHKTTPWIWQSGEGEWATASSDDLATGFYTATDASPKPQMPAFEF